MAAKKGVKVGLLGVGRWGRHLARNFEELGALVALCDHHPSHLQQYRTRAPALSLYEHHHQLLEDSTIDAVVIATRADSHFPLAKAAMEAGKDVYVEKPLCLSVLQAQQLTELAQQSGRILMVGHLLQYHPAVRRLRELVRQGQLGELHYLASHRLNLGVLGMEGSALWDLAPHDVSVILSLCSGAKPLEVNCFGGAYLEAGVPDMGVTTLSFPEQVKAHIFVSWLHPFKEHKLTVVGSEGMAVFDDTAGWDRKLQLFHQPVEWNAQGQPIAASIQPQSVPLAPAEPLREECSHFLECCATRQQPLTNGREAVAVLKVVQAAHDSLLKAIV